MAADRRVPHRRRLLGAVLAHHLDHEVRHVATFLVLGVGLALAAAAGVAWAAGFGLVAHRLRYVNPFWFPLALAGAVGAHIGYVLVYREIARVDDGPRLDPARAIALVATGFGVFVPRGGFALDLEALCDLGIPPREARTRVLGLGSLEYLVLATGTWICSVLLLAGGSHVHRAITLSWGIGVPAGTALALLALRFRSLLGRGRLGAILAPGLAALDMLGRVVFASRRHGVVAIVAMSVYWFGEVFVLWACVAAFSHRTPPVPALVVGYATGYALTRRTLPLAGAGAVEALLPFALGWVGFALAPALLAVLAYRVFNVWLPVGPALAGLVALRRGRPTARSRGDPPTEP